MEIRFRFSSILCGSYPVFSEEDIITFMNSLDKILHSDISPAERTISLNNLAQLQSYVTNDKRSLVFFVGAGASVAGNTGMPGTPNLIHQLLIGSAHYSETLIDKYDELIPVFEEVSSRLGFEITLNDLWQICPQAVTRLFNSFATLEAACFPNHVHTFLAYWLSIGGTVVTTNYDRLIERAQQKNAQAITIRYQEDNSNFSFARWKQDLTHGECLFKIHGSLDDPKSCLGALEHVGTRLVGHRAELLTDIVHTRPLCFVGWRGVDPDIPPLLSETLATRDASLPTFWLHYEGQPPGSISLDKAIQAVSLPVRPYASQKPILTDADRAFREMLSWFSLFSLSSPTREIATLDFSGAINQCSRSGMTRMLGIALRRAGQLDVGERILTEAVKLAETPLEYSAAVQEVALLQQQKLGKDTTQARQSLSKVREALRHSPDPWQQLNNDFGMLSMTITNLRSQPWLIVKIPDLFRTYRKSIEVLRRQTADLESVALHESLFSLYKGRFRFKLFGWLPILIHPLSDWILKPFNSARSTIDDAKDIHIHSHIDVLSYRAVALAHLKHCQQATEAISEIDRLIAILNDDARAKHWEKQKREISQRCS